MIILAGNNTIIDISVGDVLRRRDMLFAHHKEYAGQIGVVERVTDSESGMIVWLIFNDGTRGGFSPYYTHEFFERVEP